MHLWGNQSLVSLGILVTAVAGCIVPAASPSPKSSVKVLEGKGHHVFFLRFDAEGRWIPNVDSERAADHIAGPGRGCPLVITALGWGLNEQNYMARYLNLIDDYQAFAGDAEDVDSSLTHLCIVWDGDLAAASGALADLLPLRWAGRVAGTLLDSALFPMSFWAKADLADRIGSIALPVALDSVLDGAAPPRLYLVGHSFGGRIVTALAEAAFSIKARGASEGSTDHWVNAVAGLLLLLPAVSLAAMGLDPEYPTVVVQSDFDHANKFLFPLANLAFNTTMTKAHGHTQGDLPAKDAVLPFVVPVMSLAIFPFDYVYTQVGALRDPVGWSADTLDALPLVEIPVRLVRGEGRGASKGVFQLGSTIESVAVGRHPAVMRLDTIPGSANMLSASFHELASAKDVPELVPGLQFFDCSQAIRMHATRLGQLDMRSWWYEYVVGWFDPVGAHSDYAQPVVFETLRQLMSWPLAGSHAAWVTTVTTGLWQVLMLLG